MGNSVRQLQFVSVQVDSRKPLPGPCPAAFASSWSWKLVKIKVLLLKHSWDVKEEYQPNVFWCFSKGSGIIWVFEAARACEHPVLRCCLAVTDADSSSTSAVTPTKWGVKQRGLLPRRPVGAEVIKNWKHKLFKSSYKKIIWCVCLRGCIQPSRWKGFPSLYMAVGSGLQLKMQWWKEPAASEQGHGISKGTGLSPAQGQEMLPEIRGAQGNRIFIRFWRQFFCLTIETLNLPVMAGILVFAEEWLFLGGFLCVTYTVKCIMKSIFCAYSWCMIWKTLGITQ